MNARVCAANVAALAVAVFAASGPNVRQPSFSVIPREHRFALGEQHVYAIARTVTLIVKSRDARGNAYAKTMHADDATSIAFTVESFASDGAAVLGVSAPQPQGSSAPTATPLALTSPLPSPVIRDGNASAGGSLVALAPLAALLGGVDGPATVGKKWKAAAAFDLPLGSADVSLDDAATYSSGDDSASTLIVEQHGTARLRGSVNVPQLGRIALSGNGTASGSGFVETIARVPLGMDLRIGGGGRCTTRARAACTFLMSARVTIKLVRFVRGETPAPIVVPPFGAASAFLPGTPTSNSMEYSTPYPFATATIAAPAPTDTFFIMPYSPPPPMTPLPGVSLPPLPLPLPSGQPLATPPPPPSPSPRPR